MKRTFTMILAAGLFLAGPMAYATITIDFEAPTSFGSIGDFYAGGTDGAGVSGPNLGVSFGLDALALQNDELGPYFSNAPSPIGVMAPVGADATMNVPIGFDDVSFFYSSSAGVSVRMWSGLDGTGTLIGSFTLPSNSSQPYSTWGSGAANLGALVARSITFGDAANVAVFDNITINPIPEPGSVLLMALGLGGLATVVARRKQNRA